MSASSVTNLEITGEFATTSKFSEEMICLAQSRQCVKGLHTKEVSKDVYGTNDSYQMVNKELLCSPILTQISSAEAFFLFCIIYESYRSYQPRTLSSNNEIELF